MIIKETKMIHQVAPVGVKCDCCGATTDYGYQHITNQPLWHHFASGHYDWDNDSCDSVETFDVCSVECYWKTVKTLLLELEDYKGTAYIDNKNWPFMMELSQHFPEE